MTKTHYSRQNLPNLVAMLILWAVYYIQNLDLTVPKEFYFKTGDFIRMYGFDYETYVVESADGFLTEIFRIVNRNATLKKNQLPLLMESGLFGSSDLMVISQKEIAFALATEGFDIWLGNYRGSRYSKPGPNANFSDPHLHSFGLHEQGYDFAAAIDQIELVTGQSQIDILVTSAGSVSLLSLQATQPKYNEKIRKTLHCGPGLTMKLANFYQKASFVLVGDYSWIFTSTKILEPYKTRPNLMYGFCVKTFLAPLCHSYLHLVVGPPQDHTDPVEYALLLTVFPSGTPWGAVQHLLQLSRGDGEFRQRDWGTEENQRRYNTTLPPTYNVQKISGQSRIYTAEDEITVNYEVPRKIFQLQKNFMGEMMIEKPFQHINFGVRGSRSQKFLFDIIQTLSNSPV